MEAIKNKLDGGLKIEVSAGLDFSATIRKNPIKEGYVYNIDMEDMELVSKNKHISFDDVMVLISDFQAKKYSVKYSKI